MNLDFDNNKEYNEFNDELSFKMRELLIQKNKKKIKFIYSLGVFTGIIISSIIIYLLEWGQRM